MRRIAENRMNELGIQNRRRTCRIRLALLKRIANVLLSELIQVKAFQVGVVLVTETKMAVLNKTYLNHSGSTDVITFDYREHGDEETLRGEIFICIPDAIAQAESYKTSWQSEVVRYLIHGLLHLNGYDDIDPKCRRTMKREEQRLLKQIARRFYIDTLELDGSRKSAEKDGLRRKKCPTPDKRTRSRCASPRQASSTF